MFVLKKRLRNRVPIKIKFSFDFLINITENGILNQGELH
jgi:hypothetical protein